MSQSGLPPFFIDQKVVVNNKFLAGNSYISVHPRSSLKNRDNIESIIYIGMPGRLIDHDNETVTVLFGEKTSNPMCLIVKKFAFSFLMSATREIYFV